MDNHPEFVRPQIETDCSSVCTGTDTIQTWRPAFTPIRRLDQVNVDLDSSGPDEVFDPFFSGIIEDTFYIIEIGR